MEVEEAREQDFCYLEITLCVCVAEFAIVGSWPCGIVRSVHESVRLHVDCVMATDRNEDVEVIGLVAERGQLRGEFLVLL